VDTHDRCEAPLEIEQMNVENVIKGLAGAACLVFSALQPNPAGAGAVADRIAGGETFHVDFTGPSCPNDAGWQGTGDPMGTLKCRETYRVKFSYGNWAVTGYNEGAGKIGTWTYSGVRPHSGRLNLWGRIYRFGEDLSVIDTEYGQVGYIRLEGGAPAPIGGGVVPTAGGGAAAPGGAKPKSGSCEGIVGAPRPPLSAGNKEIERWLRCNIIGR